NGRGAARAVVDQRHLAENAVCLEGLEMTVPANDLHLSVHDNEELVATIALLEDRLAFGEIARRKPGAQEMMETAFRFWHSSFLCVAFDALCLPHPEPIAQS